MGNCKWNCPVSFLEIAESHLKLLVDIDEIYSLADW